MNKNGFILTVAILVAMAGLNIANAEESTTSTNEQVKGNVEIQGQFNRPERPPFGQFKGPHHGNFQGPPPNGKFDNHRHFEGKYPSKAEFETKKAEFDKRLKLTDEQKNQIELQRKQDHEKIKPIMEQIRAKKKEFRTILDDESLSQADKDKKLKTVKEDLKNLKGQADSIRKENMNNFETILTDKQKKEFAKIKNEQKKEMAQRKKEFAKEHFPKQAR